MIRVLIDELGDGHDDIILKIDAMPTFTQIGDLYYMADFLGLDPEKIDKVPDDLGIEYLKYVQDKIENLKKRETFIIFDISDQYIGGLLISEGKKGLLKTSYVTTDKIHGYEFDNQTIDDLIQERQPDFDKENNWLLSKDSIHEGLNWSIEKIKKHGS
jgi:hypothetical protein